MAKWFNCQLPWQGSIWLGCPTDKKVGLGNLTWLNLKKTVNKSFWIGTILMACVILSSRLHNKDFEHQNSSQTICNQGVPVAQLEICSGVIEISFSSQKMRGRSGPVSESKFELKTLKVSNDTLNVSWNHPRLVSMFLIAGNPRSNCLESTNCRLVWLSLWCRRPLLSGSTSWSTNKTKLWCCWSQISIRLNFHSRCQDVWWNWLWSLLVTVSDDQLLCVFKCLTDGLLSADDQLLCGEGGGRGEEGGRLARPAHVQLWQEGLVSSHGRKWIKMDEKMSLWTLCTSTKMWLTCLAVQLWQLGCNKCYEKPQKTEFSPMEKFHQHHMSWYSTRGPDEGDYDKFLSMMYQRRAKDKHAKSSNWSYVECLKA